MTLIEAIGLAVKEMRERRGLTQEQLAELAKMHPMSISKLERGVVRDVKFTTLFSIAEALSRSGGAGRVPIARAILRPVTVATIVAKAENIEEQSRRETPCKEK